jgi:hypothetical protein
MHSGYWHYSNLINRHSGYWELTLFQWWTKIQIQHSSISIGPDWDIVYLSADEPQTLRGEYSWATKTLDADYNEESLDDVIKACENLHVEQQHQLKVLLQKYEQLVGGILREFNMEFWTNYSPTDGF